MRIQNFTYRIAVVACLAVAVAGCRPKGDVYFDPSDPLNMAYTTYAGQFEAVWKGLNTQYVFWSVDTTDWDAVYYRMHPKFEELDQNYQTNGILPDSATLAGLYVEATSSLIDHHMQVMVRDIHTGTVCTFMPGIAEVKRREYTAGQSYTIEDIKNAVNGYVSSGLLDGGNWGKFGEYENYFGTRDVDGKKIAYLWLNSYRISELINETGETDEEKQYVSNLRGWLDMCLNDSNLLGIILDNRCNKGGQVNDLNIVVGSFISEPMHYADVRYKEGLGRYEYTEWIPAMVDTSAIPNRRDLAKANIPYVVLANAFSISMAELSAEVIKMLPTGRMIGERTFGAHGQSVSYSTIFHDGEFGSINGNHYVFTSSMQTRFVGEQRVLEGEGVSPTKTITQAEAGYEGAMEKAIDYIKAY